MAKQNWAVTTLNEITFFNYQNEETSWLSSHTNIDFQLDIDI